MMDGLHLMNGMGLMGVVFMAVFWLSIIVLAIWGLSILFPMPRQTVEEEALEILKQRFARGEISREEFEQARRTLNPT